MCKLCLIANTYFVVLINFLLIDIITLVKEDLCAPAEKNNIIFSFFARHNFKKNT